MSGITLTEVDDATIPTPAAGKRTLFADDTVGMAQKDDTGTTTSLTGATGATGATGPSYSGTSTTSLAIGTGSKTFTTQASRAYVAGTRVRAASAAAPTVDFMEGVTTSYSGTSLVVTMDLVGGSGTHTDWNLTLAGQQGASGTASVATDPIWDVKGDLAVATGADAAVRLAAGANGKVLEAASGETTGLLWDYPAGHEWAYAAITADVTTTSTSPADATGLTVTYTADGAAVIVEAYFPELRTTGSAGGDQRVVGYLYDTTAAADIQACYVFCAPAGFDAGAAVLVRAKVTPAAGSQSYKVRYKTVQAGTATIRAAATSPAYIRVTKV